MERKDAFVVRAKDLIWSPCISCKWKHINSNTCDAFPTEIPKEILSNENNHREPFIGDNGIQYKKK